MSGEDKNKDRRILEDPARLLPAIIGPGSIIYCMVQYPVSSSVLFNVSAYLFALACAAATMLGVLWIAATPLGRFTKSIGDNPYSPPMIALALISFLCAVIVMLFVLDLASALFNQETP